MIFTQITSSKNKYRINEFSFNKIYVNLEQFGILYLGSPTKWPDSKLNPEHGDLQSPSLYGMLQPSMRNRRGY